jgi:curved DNA-binding protein CbpA
MEEETENAYEILGVAENASDRKIRKAWIKQCQKWHPDKGRSESDIQMRTIRMYKFNAAKHILLDATKRAQHDAILQSFRDGTYQPQDRGSGYNTDFACATKPRPTGLARPYNGSRTKPEMWECRSDGANGINGLPGRGGWGGNGYGGHGT